MRRQFFSSRNRVDDESMDGGEVPMSAGSIDHVIKTTGQSRPTFISVSPSRWEPRSSSYWNGYPGSCFDPYLCDFILELNKPVRPDWPIR